MQQAVVCPFCQGPVYAWADLLVAVKQILGTLGFSLPDKCGHCPSAPELVVCHSCHRWCCPTCEKGRKWSGGPTFEDI